MNSSFPVARPASQLNCCHIGKRAARSKPGRVVAMALAAALLIFCHLGQTAAQAHLRGLLGSAWAQHRVGLELELHMPVSNVERAARRLAKRSGLYLAKRCDGDRRKVYRPDGGISHYKDWENKVCTAYWVVQRDSSLDDIDDMESLELSSRAKAFQDLEGDIDAVSDALCDLDARITKSCGLHVHMDMTQLSKAKMKHVLVNFARLWVRLEPLLLAVVPPSRRDNQYCEQVAPFLRGKDLRRLWYGHEYFMARDVKELLNPNGKYHTVNFPDEDRLYHTIEVRLHSGTVEAWKIKRWVKLCLQLLEVCKASWDGKMRKLVRRGSMLHLLNRFVDEEVRAHIFRRAFHFIRTYPHVKLPDAVSWLERASQHGYPQSGKWQEFDCTGCGERFPSDIPLSEATALCWSCLHKPDGGVKLSSPEIIEKPTQRLAFEFVRMLWQDLPFEAAVSWKTAANLPDMLGTRSHILLLTSRELRLHLHTLHTRTRSQSAERKKRDWKLQAESHTLCQKPRDIKTDVFGPQSL